MRTDRKTPGIQTRRATDNQETKAMKSNLLLLWRTSVKINESQSSFSYGSSLPPHLIVISLFYILGGRPREPFVLDDQSAPVLPHCNPEAIQFWVELFIHILKFPSHQYHSCQNKTWNNLFCIIRLHCFFILPLLSRLHEMGEYIPRKQYSDNVGIFKSAECCSSFS